MKRTVMMAVVALSVGLCQAAAITWVNSGANSAIYALDGTTKLTSAAATAANFSIILVNADTSATPFTTPITTMHPMVQGQMGSGSSSYVYGTQAVQNDKLYAYATATFGGTDYYMIIHASSAEDGMWTLNAVNNTGTDTFTWQNGVYGGTGASGDFNKWVAVPEPTSMALLALGVAALGLRRKFRA